MTFRTHWTQYNLACFIFTVASGTIVITPPRLVVEYGAPASAVCSTNISIQKMAWEASEGSVEPTPGVTQLTWNISKVTEWELKPLCFINVVGESKPKRRYLDVTVYKIPEKVSISLVRNTGHMIEGHNYSLQCDVQNVAPVRSLIVNWYKEQTLVKQDNNIGEEIIKQAQNKTFNLPIRASRLSDGAQYRCEAVLNLGPEGPQPPPTVTAAPLTVTVDYKPQFPDHVETLVDRGGVLTLNCNVKANPPAVYTWTTARLEEIFNTSVIKLSSPSAGNYTCTASNQYGKDTKMFLVKEQEIKVIFWSILGVGVGSALLLVLVYVLYWFWKKPSNSVV